MSRTTKDLIEELKTEATKAQRAGLIVGFEKSTEYVWSSEEKQLEKLNEMVRRKGEPVGMCIVTKGEIKMRPLQEFAKEQWVYQYLDKLKTTLKALIDTHGTEGFSV